MTRTNRAPSEPAPDTLPTGVPSRGARSGPTPLAGDPTRAETSWPRVETELEGERWPRLATDLQEPGGRETKGKTLVARLHDRKLAKWMLAYVALAWIALQLTDVLREIWTWPLGLQRGITLALAFGVLPAAVIAWYHGEKGRQRVSVTEVTLVMALIGVCAWAISRLAG